MSRLSVYHFTCFAFYVAVCIADYVYVKPEFLPVPGVFFSKFVWLTLIDLYLQAVYHFVGILVSLGKKPSPVYDLVGQTIVGPVGATVVILFWALYLSDPDTLLADDNAKAIIAIAWFNHGMHTVPLFTSVIDTIICSQPRPSIKKALSIIGVFAVLYVADIHYVHHISGFWAYPILGFLSFPLRMAFIAVCISVIFLNFQILSWIHSLANPQKKKRNVKTTKAH